MTSSPIRAVVLWADDRSANLGVRVLADGAARLLEDAFGDDVEVVFQDYGRSASGFRPDMGQIKRDLIRPDGPVRGWLRQFDVVLDTGAGDSFADIYGWRRVFTMIYVQLAARRLRIPVVLAPQTIGPFRTRRMRALARLALRTASVVAPRDPASAAFARSLGRDRLIRSTDVVFGLPRPEPETERDVVLNVSGLLWNTDDHGPRERYRTEVRALLAGLEARGRRVTLLAHVLANRTVDDDVPVVRALGEELGLEVVVPADLLDVRRTVAGARLVIGSRMHACLNALSCGTPAIAWAYSRKFAPLLGDIGWQHTVDLAADGAATRTLAIVDDVPESELLAQVESTLAATRERVLPVIEAIRALLPARAPLSTVR